MALSDADTKPLKALEDIEEDDDDIDETFTERLVGLTEMFPESFRNVCSSAAQLSSKAFKNGYGLSCNVLWAVASAATILALPAIIENERSGQLEMQKEQERQMLLGPSSAMAGGPQFEGLMPPLTASRPS